MRVDNQAEELMDTVPDTDVSKRYDVKNIGYWVVYEQIGPFEWQCVYKAKSKEDGERWKKLQLNGQRPASSTHPE